VRHAVRILRVSVWAALLFGFTSAAAAQDLPRLEASAGWSVLNSADLDESLPAGWYGDIAGNVTNTVAIVGQVTGAYKTFDETVTDFGLPVSLIANAKLHTLMGGASTQRAPASAIRAVRAGAVRRGSRVGDGQRKRQVWWSDHDRGRLRVGR
jgi:hypothetical protein